MNVTNLSNCCKAEIIEDGVFIICSKCGEECNYLILKK